MTNLKMTQLNEALIIITAVKVMLMPTAVSIFFETPKKMQSPRNLVKTKLFMRDAAIKSSKSFVNSLLIYSSLMPLVTRRLFLKEPDGDPVEKGHEYPDGKKTTSGQDHDEKGLRMNDRHAPERPFAE